MKYYTNLFSPDTFETFSRSTRNVSGFRQTQHAMAKHLQSGDQFVCYVTKLSRWVGILEVLSDCYIDETPLFYPEKDPYVVRFKVRPIVWLPKENAVPIHETEVWDALSFTKGCESTSSVWTGKVRRSLN